jgi:hypothetical protein
MASGGFLAWVTARIIPDAFWFRMHLEDTLINRSFLRFFRIIKIGYGIVFGIIRGDTCKRNHFMSPLPQRRLHERALQGGQHGFDCSADPSANAGGTFCFIGDDLRA